MVRHTLSIRAKIVLLVTTTIASAMLAALVVEGFLDVARYASARRDDLFTTARVIAAAAARPAAEEDVAGTYQAIRAMGSIPGVVFVAVDRMDGRGFADVGATEQLLGDVVLDDPATPISVPAILTSHTVEVVVPVVYSGTQVARLRLIGDTADLPERILASLGASISAGLFSLALALLVAFRLQGRITEPLRALTSTMARVGSGHDYAVAMTVESDDEVGVLVSGFNTMIADIRERDDRLAAHRDRLEQDVAERTADYRRAAREAEEANRAKSDFLATMSHEIRTPMNGILVMAELLAAGDLPPRARRQAEVVARSGSSLLAIINDILDLSKIEAGKLEVEHLEVDPVEAVDTVLRLFADRARSKGLDLGTRVDLPRGLRIDADPTRLGQVLSNLVNNALKFTEKGGVSVEVALLPPARVVFAVVDTGIGIAADKLATVFDAFSQADQTTTRKFGGTGLGLAIARRLVAAMGGEIEVASTLGEGTTFFFTLPIATAAVAGADARWAALPAALRARAVVCLDGRQSAEAAVHHLTAAGFDVAAGHPDDLAALAVNAHLVVATPAALAGRPRLPVHATGGVVAVAPPGADVDGLLRAGLADTTVAWPLARLDLDEIVATLLAGRPLKSLEEATAARHDGLARFDGLRVLVADDAEVNREVAAAALGRLGITADFVVDGREAVDAVAAKDYDIVLMDGSMPVMDGFDATRTIRAAEAATGRPRTPVVALTAHVIGTAADAWRTAGMDGVLHKPFTLAQLAEAIRTHATNVVESAAEPEPSPAAAPAAALPNAAAPMAAPAAEPAEEEAPALDAAVLDDLRAMSGGAMVVVDRITRLYETQSVERLAELRAALAAGDLDALGKAAHALKSMSFNVGARSVAERAAACERAARVDERLVEPGEIERIGTDISRALDEIDRWKKAAA